MKRTYIVVFIAAVILAAIAFWPSSRIEEDASSTATLDANEDVVPVSNQMTPVPVPSQPFEAAAIAQPLPQGLTEAEKLAWWQAMEDLDYNFKFKMPIAFFGLVVDDVGNPVPAATIEFSWVDLSEKGTSQAITVSDALGYFSLDGAVGKRLLINVTKEGYKPEHSKNQYSFEYADFRLSDYHDPDSSEPVKFVLRENRPSEPLVYRGNQRAQVALGQQRSFPIGLERGASSPNIVVEILSNTSGAEKAWSARVSVPGGGLVLTTDEFPFEAPEEGYAPSADIDMSSAKPRNWPGGNGGTFFVKTSQGYARVEVRNTLGSSWVYVTSFFNPSGSRNLEDNPDIRIEPQ